MFRRLLSLAAILSLGFSVLTVVIWVQASSRAWEVRNLTLGGNRYACVFDQGVTLFGPPRTSPADPAERQLVDDLLHRMNDSEFTFRSGSFDYDIVWTDGIPRMHSWGMMLEGCPAARRLMQEPRPVVQRATRALLATLDDPSRFASAHWTLVQMSEPPASRSLGAQWLSLQEYPRQELEDVIQRDRAAGCLRSSYDRLPVALMHDGQQEIADGSNWGPLMRGVAKFDPSQLPLIRDQWHRRLDVQVWPTIRFRTIVIVLLMLPAFFMAEIFAGLFRTRRRRQGFLCVQCGYDLRATRERCPECGTVTAAT